MKLVKLLLAIFFCTAANVFAQTTTTVVPAGPYVAVVKLDQIILAGTYNYLQNSLDRAEREGAKAVVVLLDTPGGVLETTQEIVQAIFKSKVPVYMYVFPQGGTASSAGVFITLAAHVAAMAPGTSIGAATPIQGDGKDIAGDMRQKAINATISMARSIAEQRGRNAAWAEDAVRNASSITEQDALSKKVIDFVSPSIEDLLKVAAGKKVLLAGSEVTLEDHSKLPRIEFEMGIKDRAINFLANPNVVALLWLLATSGLSIELYNPGLILPGVVGVICLILALSVSSVIPISQAAIILLVVGAVLIGLELFTGSLILGIGGVVSILFGALYLIDSSQAPGLAVAIEVIGPIAAVLGLLLLFIAFQGARALKSKALTTGKEGMAGLRGKAMSPITAAPGRILVRGEIWSAVSGGGEPIATGDSVEVVKVAEGLLLEVKKI